MKKPYRIALLTVALIAAILLLERTVKVAAAAAPTGMTDWDQTFLKSLYATEQKSKLQRSQIAHRMVSDLKP